MSLLSIQICSGITFIQNQTTHNDDNIKTETTAPLVLRGTGEHRGEGRLYDFKQTDEYLLF